MISKILILTITLLGWNCSKKDLDNQLGTLTGMPVFSQLLNNRMVLLLKGTYATDDPIDFSDYRGGTGALYIDEFGGEAGPEHTLTGLPSAGNLPIFIDFGEIRLSTQFQKGFNELSQIRDPLDSEKFWDFIAPVRQVYCTIPYSLEDDTCQSGGGVFKAQEFFNGNGAIYPSNDPTAETYDCSNPKYLPQCLSAGLGTNAVLGTQYWYTGVYFRSFVTGWSILNGAPLLDQTRFDNRRVPGVNIVPRNNYKPGTTDVEKQQTVPKFFPLLYSVQGTHRDMQIRGGIDPYILEIRMNIKENLMVHTINRPGGIRQTLVSMSDWRFDNRGETDIGGNVLLRSRVIYPEFASSLNITGGGGDLRYYYAVYHRDEEDLEGHLPLAATPARPNARIQYLMKGRYKLLCRGDIQREDGYPETVLGETEFEIGEFARRETININLSCP